MKKIKNQKQNYTTRAKLVNKNGKPLKSIDNKNVKCRENCIVDKNGYLNWSESQPSKNNAS